MKTLTSKIWVFMLAFIVMTISFMYALTDFLYDRLYVMDSESAMIEVGNKLKSQYYGGAVSDDFVALVEEYNKYSNYNVFAVRNPRELSACVPFEVDYDTLIGPEERKLLLNGESFTKIGYQERFNREVISVILPLVDENRLEGIIYIYYPLAKITELAKQELLVLIIAALIFTILSAILCTIGIRHILKPLNRLHRAVQKMTTGNYETRVAITSEDEIGQLSKAFNQMATVIQKEDESQKTFLSTVSHELRTPISYIKGYSELMEQGLLPLEKQKEAITLIARESNRMERLTNDLLQLARKEPLTTRPTTPVILAECMREAAAILQNNRIEKQITLKFALDETVIVEGDEAELKQIIINVLENAIRYSDHRSEIQLNLYTQQAFALIEIIDEGIGIAKEDLEKVMTRFYRVNKARSRADGGSGLGLSIVDKLVQKHQGEVEIESQLGKGTTVRIKLPKVLLDDDE